MKNEVIPLIQTYDGKKIGVIAKTDTGYITIPFSYNNYCLTNALKEDVDKIQQIREHPGIVAITESSKIDLLSHQRVHVTKIEGKTPKDIRVYPYGKKKSSVCSILESNGYTTWEARGFRHDLSFLMDNNILFLMPCSFQDIKAPVRNKKSFSHFLGNMTDLIETPLPKLSYVCIAVRPMYENLQQMKKGFAFRPVESCAVIDYTGKKDVFTYIKNFKDHYLEFDMNVCTSEIELINKILSLSRQYDIVLSYGGDFLDFRYVWHRARSLGFANFPPDFKYHNHGLHSTFLYSPLQFDLYRFLSHAPVRLCTGKSFWPDIESVIEELYQEKITENANPVIQSIIDVKKIQKLIEWQNSFFLNLLLISMRVFGRTNDLILNPLWKTVEFQMCKFHKQQGFLIPNRTPGYQKREKKVCKVFENVFVLDKRVTLSQMLLEWNVSYETVNCTHAECKKNAFDKDLWTCSERKGVFPLLIESLMYWLKKMRDLKTPIPGFLTRTALLLILREVPECMLYGRFTSKFQRMIIQRLDGILERQIEDPLAKKDVKILYSDAEYIMCAHEMTFDELASILQKSFSKDFLIEGPFEKLYYSNQKKFMYGSEKLPLRRIGKNKRE